jgi:hypothetical protein
MAADAARWQQYFRDAPPQVGDEQAGDWSHAQLVRSRQAATAMYTPESGRQRA